MIHNLHMSRLSKSAVAQGFGPFSSHAIAALVSGICEKCGRAINEFSLFGNSLVVAPGKIRVLCCKCRTGRQPFFGVQHPFVASPRNSLSNNTINRATIVGEVVHLLRLRTLDFSYHDYLLCLRTGFGSFQRFSRKAYAGFSRMTLEAAKDHFGRALPSSCHECGALWANAWEMSRPNIQELLAERGYNTNHCWSCYFPHSEQWFLRIDLASELQILNGV